MLTDAAELREEAEVLEEAMMHRDDVRAAAFAEAAEGENLYDVQLDDLWHLIPKYRIGAIDRLNAIEKYKNLCGITATEHEFKVKAIE